jgi:hypothetical protein
VVPALAVLQRQVGHPDGGHELGPAPRLHLAQLREQLPGVRGQRREHLHALAHGQVADVVLRVPAQLALGDQVGGVLLGLQAGRDEVAVPHRLRVVQADHRAFETHFIAPLSVVVFFFFFSVRVPLENTAASASQDRFRLRYGPA